MKISTEHVSRILATYFNKVQNIGAEKPVAPALINRADQATFSARAEEIESALRIIADQPEVRADKVAELRQQIADGTFQISPETIAEKILTEARLEKVLE